MNYFKNNYFKKLTAILLALAIIFSTGNISYGIQASNNANNVQTREFLTDTIIPNHNFPTTNSEKFSTSNEEILALITDASIISTTTNAITDYSKTKELASKKAAALSSIYGATSVQYALIDNGEIVLSGVSGVYGKSNKTPLTSENMYCIASISKMFTSTAMMQLVDEGKLNLDTPIVTYIKEFKMKDERYKNITPRMLLNHSSGLMGSTFRNSILLGETDTYSHDNFLKEIAKQRLKANPGEFSVYCNDGFTLAELLIERISGKSFSSYIQENITQPLGMSHTKTPLDKFSKSKLAKVYLPASKAELPNDIFNTIGAGGMFSSAEDLCKFAQTFMNESNGILSKDSVLAMSNKEYLRGMWLGDTNDDNILGYGLGWDCVNTYPFTQYGIQALTKGGDSLLTHSNLLVLPEHNMAVAVLSVGSASTYNQVAGQEILLSALQEKGVIENIIPNKTFQKPSKQPLPQELKAYEGIYISNNTSMKITLDDDGTLNLYPLLDSEDVFSQYSYTGDGKFVSTNGHGYLKFVHEKNGKDYLYSSEYATIPGIGQTAMSYYISQKIKDNNLSKGVNDSWKKRDKKRYLLITEKYSSQYYLVSSLAFEVDILGGINGYVDNAFIVDKNNAMALVQIPVIASRDLYDFKFYKKNSIEYFATKDEVYIAEAGLKNLSAKKKVTYTIAKDGYAKWYKISTKLHKKKIKVTSPKKSAVVIYDKNDNLIYNSYVTGNKTITLPKGGYIGFVSNANAKFTVEYK